MHLVHRFLVGEECLIDLVPPVLFKVISSPKVVA